MSIENLIDSIKGSSIEEEGLLAWIFNQHGGHDFFMKWSEKQNMQVLEAYNTDYTFERFVYKIKSPTIKYNAPQPGYIWYGYVNVDEILIPSNFLLEDHFEACPRVNI